VSPEPAKEQTDVGFERLLDAVLARIDREESREPGGGGDSGVCDQGLQRIFSWQADPLSPGGRGGDDERYQSARRGGHAAGVDAAVICEPEENQLCIKQKGALRVGVTVRGRMAHGTMPASGINPVTRAARFVVAVERLEREDIEIERHGEDPFLGYPSLTPTVLMGPESGEPQINVIPASAYVALDIRTAPDQAHERRVGRLEEILANLEAGDPDFDATLEVIEERPPTETPKDEPLVGAMAAAYHRLTGEEPRYNGVPGATDGTILHAWAGFPIVTTGAGDREIPHHTDEWVGEEELLATCKIYAVTAMYYCYGKDTCV
jgi:succinyl-diaminopimelate desuccinylase